MSENDSTYSDIFKFEKADATASPDERIAAALEFMAKHIGEISRSVDHLNTQMDSLIRATEM